MDKFTYWYWSQWTEMVVLCVISHNSSGMGFEHSSSSCNTIPILNEVVQYMRTRWKKTPGFASSADCFWLPWGINHNDPVHLGNRQSQTTRSPAIGRHEIDSPNCRSEAESILQRPPMQAMVLSSMELKVESKKVSNIRSISFNYVNRNCFLVFTFWKRWQHQDSWGEAYAGGGAHSPQMPTDSKFKRCAGAGSSGRCGFDHVIWVQEYQFCHVFAIFGIKKPYIYICEIKISVKYPNSAFELAEASRPRSHWQRFPEAGEPREPRVAVESRVKSRRVKEHQGTKSWQTRSKGMKHCPRLRLQWSHLLLGTKQFVYIVTIYIYELYRAISVFTQWTSFVHYQMVTCMAVLVYYDHISAPSTLESYFNECVPKLVVWRWSLRGYISYIC